MRRGLWTSDNPSNPPPNNNNNKLSKTSLRKARPPGERATKTPARSRRRGARAAADLDHAAGGRYLPEYRETRKAAGSFLELCLTPELAAEVTLQPIRRFDFDAAILFSDILVVPHALGQKVTFEEGAGPASRAARRRTSSRSIQTVSKNGWRRSSRRCVGCGATLVAEKALIGFCGAPWTVATYMIAGRGTPEQLPARRLRWTNPERLQALIDMLVEASARYLVGQIEAGADVVKIFDSWAGDARRGGFRALVHPRRSRRSSSGCAPRARGADHRLSARRRRAAWRLCRKRPASMPSRSTG